MFTSTSDEFSKQFGIPVSENVDNMSMIKITTTSKSNIKTLAKFLLFGLSEEMSYTVGNNTWYICETRLIDTTSVKLRDIPVGINNLNERRIEMMISIGFRKELLSNKPKPISILDRYYNCDTETRYVSRSHLVTLQRIKNKSYLQIGRIFM